MNDSACYRHSRYYSAFQALAKFPQVAANRELRCSALCRELNDV